MFHRFSWVKCRGDDLIRARNETAGWISLPCAFRPDGGKGHTVFCSETGGELLEEERRAVFVCVVCGWTIASEESRMSFGGRHAHTLFNPYGIVFELGCFSRAPGCFCQGPPTADFTWFKGYAWEFALCEKCGEHLGWHYISVENDFFGLILKKIAAQNVDGE